MAILSSSEQCQSTEMSNDADGHNGDTMLMMMMMMILVMMMMIVVVLEGLNMGHLQR